MVFQWHGHCSKAMRNEREVKFLKMFEKEAGRSKEAIGDPDDAREEFAGARLLTGM